MCETVWNKLVLLWGGTLIKLFNFCGLFWFKSILRLKSWFYWNFVKFDAIHVESYEISKSKLETEGSKPVN